MQLQRLSTPWIIHEMKESHDRRQKWSWVRLVERQLCTTLMSSWGKKSQQNNERKKGLFCLTVPWGSVDGQWPYTLEQNIMTMGLYGREEQIRE